MLTAYGKKPTHSSGTVSSIYWYKLWSEIIHHDGRHYDLPKGSVGRTYVSQMIEEVQQFTAGNFPSE